MARDSAQHGVDQEYRDNIPDEAELVGLTDDEVVANWAAERIETALNEDDNSLFAVRARSLFTEAKAEELVSMIHFYIRANTAWESVDKVEVDELTDRLASCSRLPMLMLTCRALKDWSDWLTVRDLESWGQAHTAGFSPGDVVSKHFILAVTDNVTAAPRRRGPRQRAAPLMKCMVKGKTYYIAFQIRINKDVAYTRPVEERASPRGDR